MRVLISLSDKQGIESFAKGLVELGAELISTGNTKKYLEEFGLKVTSVSEVTKFPEILEGRVKTLHPFIHGGLLAKNTPEHRGELEGLGIKPIDMVVVNLYPFEETVAKEDVTLDLALENIDIGGPTMIRAAAKNFQNVVVLTDKRDYPKVLQELKEQGEVSFATRKGLALKAFTHTALYDSAIINYLSEGEKWNILLEDKETLRYGENPHQKGWVYKLANDNSPSLLRGRQLQGKEMSYNNYNDGNGALEALLEFSSDKATAVAVKHSTPCGIGQGGNLREAFINCKESDPLSIFGGIVALNREVDRETAEEMKDIFLEVIIAPKFSTEALEVLGKKKNLRLLEVELPETPQFTPVMKTIQGGVLVQEYDEKTISLEEMVVVAGKPLSLEEKEQALFAFKCVKHVKSNAIVVTKDFKTLGISGGQTSRIDAARQALEKAEGKGATILASDAFFPFDDVVRLAAEKGIKIIIQPGGSINDQLSIKACEELGITMVFTNVRHFKH
ncbi:IMP cyclohydrolase [Anaerobranca californiensis DSM 14826]|jgi:phosphoribosylaminoimidazolecarboxamide formyltransferase/IMP cyclohydrolase|uniref:Bifunctional purine biosynthesis protein PurH n=1 Tax=Anaerobranca californiensis DSM 14826 TaxID=1120989 RepID=A0A1M6PX27_9FIRM|nr:bifunctional phosphoribosylaminoimidazolecarboxamide formyltransferase/IMP cyclohydrolase [Anaerobranca californiensis]SHK12523.1 IMP cyclohydrolase [Anaerobranca californiensis DSM 14826]